jgi:hypothetical protein
MMRLRISKSVLNLCQIFNNIRESSVYLPYIIRIKTEDIQKIYSVLTEDSRFIKVI